MANKKKYYAVRAGHHPGIYDTWDACRKETDHYPGAIFKSFSTMAEAEAFMRGADQVDDLSQDLVAYVDGSYNLNTGIYGYGVILLKGGKRLKTLSGAGEDPIYQSMRNVAGEIMGSLSAASYALAHGYDHLTIVYDYAGIEEWVAGRWKANKEGTKAYQAKMREMMQSLQIDFIKVQAHTGNTHNEEADKLAKEAAGVL